MSHAVLEVRVEVLEEWKKEHSREDDARHERHEQRIQSLELSRVKILAWVGGAAAGGSAMAQLLFWIMSKM